MSSVRARRSSRSRRPLLLEPLEARALLASDLRVLPAALVDDAYEQNDSRFAPRNLGTISSTQTFNNLVMADANDWYRFTTTSTGGAGSEVRIDFLHAQGDLDLWLYRGNGTFLARSDGSGNRESLSLGNLPAGTYMVRVFGYNGAQNPNYSLTVDLGSTLADDTYEENDTQAAARDLGALSIATTFSNLVMADGHDWYSFSMTGSGTSSDFVSIALQNAQGNLDLEVYTSAGQLMGRDTGTTNSERISLNGRPAGTYYVHVYGFQGASNPNYSLTIDPGTGGPLVADLAGASLSLPASANWGQSIAVTSRVRNQGTAAANSFQVQWHLSRDPLGSSDDVLLAQTGGATSYTHSPLVAGAVGNQVTVNLALPSALPSGWSGSNFYIVMRTDSAGVVPELNEANNFGQAGLGLDHAAIAIGAAPPTGGFTITMNITGMNASQIAIFNQAAARWAQVITGDLPNATYLGQTVDDVLIDASGIPIDGPGGILGQAGFDRVRSGSLLPYHGIMQFDTADLAQMQANGSLLSVIIHEMGHVLGIGTLWQARGLLSGGGTSDPRFTGAQARAEYNTLFGVNQSGVPVENTGGPGTRDGHWRESILGNEVMTGYAGPGSFLPISRITIASLADLGYTVNLNAADPYLPPLVAGLSAGSTGAAGAAGETADYHLEWIGIELGTPTRRDRQAIVDAVLQYWQEMLRRAAQQEANVPAALPSLAALDAVLAAW